MGTGGDLIVAVRDLTERRRKEQSLSLLFHRNPAPIWVSSLGNRMQAVNPAALRLHGYDEETFLSLKALLVNQWSRSPCGGTNAYSPRLRNGGQITDRLEYPS